MIKCGPYRNFNNGWEPLTKEETKALNDNSPVPVEENADSEDDSDEAECR